MPQMNGIEAARVLKKILPQTPIVLLTSHDPSTLGYDTHAACIDAVVAKDGHMSLLMASLQSLRRSCAPCTPNLLRWFVRISHVSGMSISSYISVWNDSEAKALAEQFGAKALIDKAHLFSELIPAIKTF
jgi:DNA-binding response OmpR family regulator